MIEDKRDDAANDDVQQYAFKEVVHNELPLSTRDETPPLLLDLPEGQQLVVGKLPDGIVIEIATWRGTGRPDSRTNRMMLGVSYDEDVIEESKKKSFFGKIKRSSGSTDSVKPEKSEEEVQVEVETADSHRNSESVSVPESEEPNHENEPSIQVTLTEMEEMSRNEIEGAEAVVLQSVDHKSVDVSPAHTGNNQRNMQDLFGARPRTQVFSEKGERETSLNKHAHEIVPRAKSHESAKSSWSKGIKWLAIAATFGATLYLAAVPGQLRIVHPDLGLQTSLSSAEDTLIIVKQEDSYSVGENIVARSESDSGEVIFGSVAAISSSEYILTENGLYHSTLKSEVFGKAILVMPGLGKLFAIFG